MTRHRPWVAELVAHPNIKAKIADEDHGTSYAEVRNAVRLQRLSPYAWHWDERLGWRVFVEAGAESGLPLLVIMAEVEGEEDVWVLRSAWRRR